MVRKLRAACHNVAEVVPIGSRHLIKMAGVNLSRCS